MEWSWLVLGRGKDRGEKRPEGGRGAGEVESRWSHLLKENVHIYG